MFKKIITNKTVVVNAMYPTIENKILFSDFNVQTNTLDQSEVFTMNIYKVIEEATEETEGVYEILQQSTRRLTKEQLDVLVGSLTIESTTYTDIRNEQICKGLAKVIEDESLFGLTEADLIIL
jgi:hypothetical protein